MPVTSRSVHHRAPVAYEYLTFTRTGATTGNVTNAFRFRVARDAIIHQIELSASAVSGTSPTCSAALKRGAATLVSTANLTAAGTVVASPTLANQAVRANDALTVDLAVGGTSPSYTDINVIVVLRTGGPEFTGGVRL